MVFILLSIFQNKAYHGNKPISFCGATNRDVLLTETCSCSRLYSTPTPWLMRLLVLNQKSCEPCSYGVVVKVLGSVLYDEMRALTHDVCSSSSRVINTNCHAIKMKLNKEFVSLLPSFKLQRKFAFEILCCCCLL